MKLPSTTIRTLRCFAAITIFFMAATTSWAQLSDAAQWAVQVQNKYEIYPNTTYHIANNYEAKLDVYSPQDTKSPVPVVMMIHGGGWVEGSKEEVAIVTIP